MEALQVLGAMHQTYQRQNVRLETRLLRAQLAFERQLTNASYVEAMQATKEVYYFYGKIAATNQLLEVLEGLIEDAKADEAIGCDECHKDVELYYNEATGLALCEDCDFKHPYEP